MKRTLPLFLVAPVLLVSRLAAGNINLIVNGDFTGTGSAMALTFTSLNTNGIYNAGAAIDKVSVVSLPDPAFMALLLGLATLFLAVAGPVVGGTLVRVRAERR